MNKLIVNKPFLISIFLNKCKHEFPFIYQMFMNPLLWIHFYKCLWIHFCKHLWIHFYQKNIFNLLFLSLRLANINFVDISIFIFWKDYSKKETIFQKYYNINQKRKIKIENLIMTLYVLFLVYQQYHCNWLF